MNTKLTLKLNESVIDRAKKYASQKKISLSNLIENYLDSITNEEKKSDDIEISPYVKSISSGHIITDDIDWKKERDNYIEHLEFKHS